MLRDPPHYLKALKTTRTPQRLLWLNCAGYTAQVHGRFVQKFRACAIGSTHWTARKHVRKDHMAAFIQPDDLWEYVANWCPSGRRVVLFAYDLAEQLRLSQLLTHLPQAGWDIDKIVLERTAAWCSLRQGKRTLLCCDLQAWCPVPFERIASEVLETVPIEREAAAGNGFSVQKCIYRASVIREACLQIFEWIGAENHGPFKPTGSGQSYSAYRRRFMADRLLVHDDTERLQAERTAMATGRAEAWRHGYQNQGPYAEHDLHAAYCTIGRDCRVPTIARASVDNPSQARLERLLDRYAVLADVTVKTSVECVPCVVNGRSLWPVGEFRTWLWCPELRLALEHAESVKVHRAYTYTQEPALASFCEYVLEGMDGQTTIYGLVPRMVLKHWSRCLVGRLGLRYRAWHKFGDHYPPDVRLVTFLDFDTGDRTDMLIAGTKRMILGDMTESPESLPQIPGWVMSECRKRLWELMLSAGLENIVYVDTDSVIVRQGICNVPGSWNRLAADYGLAHKGTYKTMTIYGPRNLTVGNDRRVSGLPLQARQMAPLEFTGEVMRSVKQSMRHGELDSIVSLPRDFHLQPMDLRRKHNANGSTSPYVLEVDNSDAGNNG